MKKVFALLLVAALAVTLVACGPEVDDSAIYRTLYSTELTTLNYLTTGNQSDQAVGANCIDTLVEYNNKGALQPSLATEWSHNAEKTVWTLKLREDCKWYDYQGNEIAEVTAHDFVAAAKYACTAEYDSSSNSPLLNYVVGAQDFFDGLITDFSNVGVKAIDDHTLEYTLSVPTPYFLSMLSYGCFMPAYGPQLEQLGKDFGSSNDKMYYCGAYILQVYEPQVRHVYIKNQNNWDANNIFIGTIEQTYNAEAATIAPEMVLRGEIDFADLTTTVAEAWLKDNPEYVSLARTQQQWSYFYSFNFDPQFDAAFEPDNWKIAVNNKNFRKAITLSLDSAYTLAALDPNNAAEMMLDTITPAGFVTDDNGKDFTDYLDFSAITGADAQGALAAKQAAVTELTAAGATFPIKVLLPYNANSEPWGNECVLVKTALERSLGTDFVEVIIEARPSSGFLSGTRRNGNYAFLKTNWGADYQDPETFTDPFNVGNSYQFMDKVLADEDPNVSETKALVTRYYELLAAAKAETADTQKRFEKFAAAEYFLIENYLLIPYSTSTVSYQATRLDVYEGQFAAFGISILRYKGQHLLEDFVSMSEFEANKAKVLG